MVCLAVCSNLRDLVGTMYVEFAKAFSLVIYLVVLTFSLMTSATYTGSDLDMSSCATKISC